MKLNAKFAREAILNKDGLNHLLLEITPPPKVQYNRKPALIIFVLDKSGSMDDIVAGEYGNKHGERATKLDYAKNSTIKFLSLLSEDDLFGVVSFDDLAFVEQGLTTIKNGINPIVNNIRNIQTGGCTNISDGILTARNMIKDENIKNYTCKIILLSDGEANRGNHTQDGLSSIALSCLKDGITISTLGIGVEYRASIMGAIAESGSGLFYHVEDLSKLNEVFKDELNLSNIVTAKNVKLHIAIPSLIEISENMNNYPQNVTKDEIILLLGDIHNMRKVLFEVRNNFVDEDIIFKFKVSYNSLDGHELCISNEKALKVVSTTKELKEAEDVKDVIEYVLSMVKSRTVVNATKSYEDGDMVTLKNSFRESSEYLENLNSEYKLDSPVFSKVMEDMENLDSVYSSPNLSKSQAKKMYQNSNRMSRE